ncbi:hypothetical protein [Elstera cyanobacteriorum]|uniref:hypothetical protein n=1 Tax=Elstera cyanobacteriorum TaxID=2022747 RepID=UPI002352CF61|nr:hypothetical protein [Elstera cyanobacteriorum]MCK6443096.1 hypothetical protein [Elstera cyanobacteriorum]
MPCLNPDGTLTRVARDLLTALEPAPVPAPVLASATGLPLWRVRASLRELAGQDLVAASGPLSPGDDAPHVLTETGRQVLDLSRALDGED